MNHKICFVGNEITPSEGSTFVGGHVNTVVGLCKGLADLGWEIHIITTPSRFLKNVNFIFPWAKFHLVFPAGTNNSLNYNFDYLRKAIQAVQVLNKSEHFELVHGHSGYFGPSIVPSLLKQKLGIPALFSIYCPASLLPRKMPSVDRYSIRALSLGLDRIIAVTENVKASLTNYSVDPRKIIVLPSCFDEKVYSQFAHQGSSATTQTMNFKAPKVLFVGNVEKTKGLDIFIDAAKLVLSEKSTTKFIITLHEPEECLQRAWLLAHQKLGNSIEVLGVVKNMASLISEVDVVVVPFRSTQGVSDIPIIVLEAMALGKPVVASNLEGVKEAIKDGQNGLIVDISNPIKLAESINYLLDNPAFCRKIGSEAAISAKEYSSSEISRKLSNIYLNIME